MNLPNCPKCGSKGRFYHSNEVEFACTSVMRENVIAVESAGCLRIQRDQLQDRIKRLEEAGDALYENSDPTRWDSMQAANRKLDQQEEWRKAKEAHP